MDDSFSLWRRPGNQGPRTTLPAATHNQVVESDLKAARKQRAAIVDSFSSAGGHHGARTPQPLSTALSPISSEYQLSVPPHIRALEKQAAVAVPFAPVRRKTALLNPVAHPTGKELPQLLLTEMSDPTTQKRQTAQWLHEFGVASIGKMPQIIAWEAMRNHVHERTEHELVPEKVALNEWAPKKAYMRPHPLRVGTAVHLLDKMAETLRTGHGPLLQQLVNDVKEGLYVEVPHATKGTEGNLSAHQLAVLGLDPMTGGEVFSKKPFFESYYAVRDDLHELQVEHNVLLRNSSAQKSVLSRGISVWQNLSMRAVFFAWRGVIKKEREHVTAVARFVNRFEKRDVLQAHFYAWRLMVLAESASRARAQLTQGVQLIQQQEANTFQKVELLEDELEEAKLLISRLKEQTMKHHGDSNRMIKQMEVSLTKSEHWRALAISSLSFLHEMKQQMVQRVSVTGYDHPAASELAVKVILGWIAETIKDLPQAAKVKTTNFGNDLRDGNVYILLLHKLNRGETSLDNFGHQDVQRRFQVIVDTLRNIEMGLPITIQELLSGSTDIHFVVLFSLWWHHADPNYDAQATCLGDRNNFRDDLLATQKFLDELRTGYPQWLHHRSVLMELALYVQTCRIRGAPAKVQSLAEEKLLEAAMVLFEVTDIKKAPAVFLDHGFMSAHQRKLNEEERQRVNNCIRRHIGLLKNVYVHYTSTDTSAAVPAAAPSPSGKSPSRSPKEQALKVEEPDSKKKKDKLNDMNFVSFYRFCEECRLIANDDRYGKNDRWKMTKSECYHLFMEVCRRFLDGSKSMREAVFKPTHWIIALLKIGVQRFGIPVGAGSTAPAEGASCLEQFIATDISPFACASAMSPFEQEVWSAPVQDYLSKKRKILIPFYEYYAGLDGDGTMNYFELTEGMKACNAMKEPITEEVLREVFAHFTSKKDDDGKATGKKVARREEDNATEKSGDSDDDNEPAIVYGEFELLLVTLCVHVFPSPHLPLSVKVERYLDPYCAEAAKALKKVS